jgi:hypothetical protein
MQKAKKPKMLSHDESEEKHFESRSRLLLKVDLQIHNEQREDQNRVRHLIDVDILILVINIYEQKIVIL